MLFKLFFLLVATDTLASEKKYSENSHEKKNKKNKSRKKDEPESRKCFTKCCLL